ncbi:MAG: DoxX family protein [Acidobacteriaceae bacterium]
MVKKVAALYHHFSKSASWLQSPLLLLVRLYWGWQFMQTGWGKLQHLDRVIGFFQSLGIPFPGIQAPLVAGMEFFGGLLLILGLGSRIVGLILAFDMLVAYWTASRDALFSVISNPGNFYNADPYTFLFASLMVLIFGAGIFSIDALIARRFRSLTAQS